MPPKNNRYMKFRRVMSCILLADFAVFIVFLIGAGLGIDLLKTLSSIIAITTSLLCLGYLYITREIFKKRSLWMSVAAAAVLFCVLFSLALNYPCPAPTPESIHLNL